MKACMSTWPRLPGILSAELSHTGHDENISGAEGKQQNSAEISAHCLWLVSPKQGPAGNQDVPWREAGEEELPIVPWSELPPTAWQFPENPEFLCGWNPARSFYTGLNSEFWPLKFQMLEVTQLNQSAFRQVPTPLSQLEPLFLEVQMQTPEWLRANKNTFVLKCKF